MKKNEPEINGEWPDLEGKTLQELLAQECWYQKDLEEEANVILIKAEGTWHHLYFDMGTLFCRMSQDEPHEITTEDRAEISYHLRDLGVDLDLVGRVIKSCSAKVIPGGSKVEIGFEGGKKISFKNVDNMTSYET
ncbi:MAG: hypothetical protein IMF07_09555 [Proteobacteria bacterium]|nr:hypothetical protein [Pseudomonadota bacterium]